MMIKIGLLLLSFISGNVYASQIHTLTLQHRLATEVLPQIQPFLPENATVRAYGDKLIVKADNATMATISDLLTTLDKPLNSLTITVLRTQQRLDQNQGINAQGQLQIGDSTSASVQTKVWSTQQAREKDQQYRARAIEGNPVTINMGEAVPQQRYLLFTQPDGGVGVVQDTDYIALQNGFRAVPFVMPQNKVKVEIQPFFSNLSETNRHIESSDVLTTVEGQLGEWLAIGQVTDNVERSARGLSTYSSRAATEQYIYLKVELAN